MIELPSNLTSRLRRSSAASVDPTFPCRSDLASVEEAVVALTVSVVAVTAAIAAGRAAVAPVLLVGGIVVAAARVDLATHRIPNTLTVLAAAIVVAGIGPVAVIDRIPVATMARDVGTGALLSGAPIVFAVWFVAPRLIGGGDWKLLGVGGGAIGMVAPTAAVLMGLIGFALAVVVAALMRRREVALGPGLAAGYLAAVAAALAVPGWLGVVQ